MYKESLTASASLYDEKRGNICVSNAAKMTPEMKNPLPANLTIRTTDCLGMIWPIQLLLPLLVACLEASRPI